MPLSNTALNISTNKSIALLTVLIMIMIITIIAAVVLNLLSNQVRLIEHDVSRAKSMYANEAAMVRQIAIAREGGSFEASHNVSGRYDDFGQNFTVNIDTGDSSIPGVTELNFTIDYSTPF